MNSKGTILAGLAAAALLVAGGLAIAGPAGKGAGDCRAGKGAQRAMMRAAMPDANGDGVISRREFLQAAERRFARLDADGDGRISIEEWRQRRGMGQMRRARLHGNLPQKN